MSLILDLKFYNCMNSYISQSGQSAIRKFKYNGGDLSISYKYVWSPIAQKIVEIIPKTWAPNTITIVGFLIQVIATIVLISQRPFNKPAPAWTLILYGIAVFIYQTLDNVDGKQARRIHNSTPLGMVMDHGCDALSLLFHSIGMSRILCLNDFQLILWVFTIGVSFTFYISVWCQYYSGVMILGRINAVDDGIPVIWLSALYSAFFGQEIWTMEITIFASKYVLNTLIATTIVLGGVIQIYSIISHAGQSFTKDIGQAATDLLHLALLTFSIYSINMHSNLCQKHFTGVYIAIGFTMARTITYTLVCVVTSMDFRQFQPSVLIFGLVYPIYIYLGQGIINEGFIVYGVASAIVFQYSFYIMSVIQHMAKALNIRIFHVFDPQQIKKQ